ncbi:hypothetical protein [Streptomyces sp. SA15]|nr:hypothetical protein [Streptomyces sp. SA15]
MSEQKVVAVAERQEPRAAVPIEWARGPSRFHDPMQPGLSRNPFEEDPGA